MLLLALAAMTVRRNKDIPAVGMGRRLQIPIDISAMRDALDDDLVAFNAVDHAVFVIDYQSPFSGIH